MSKLRTDAYPWIHRLRANPNRAGHDWQIVMVHVEGRIRWRLLLRDTGSTAATGTSRSVTEMDQTARQHIKRLRFRPNCTNCYDWGCYLCGGDADR